MTEISWIESANGPKIDFTLENLPYCSFSTRNKSQRLGVAIGDSIVDLHELAENQLLPFRNAFLEPNLNKVIGLSATEASELRQAVQSLLRDQPGKLRDDQGLQDRTIQQRDKVYLHLPVNVGDYSDFYASLYHATNVGAMFRPENPLLPNYKSLPVGYHGRSSSIIVSGTSVRRPWGQQEPPNGELEPTFAPSRKLDYELELGIYLRGGNQLGTLIDIESAEAAVFGVCLLNDWSARDIQKWEYQPLGPFLAKSFATSVSPFVVPWEALERFRVPAFSRADSDPPLSAHLDSEANRTVGGLDLHLDVFLRSQTMREKELEPFKISSGNFCQMYWTVAQMVTHHASNGCNLRPGDLLGSGTVSGTEKTSRGCLLERNWAGDLENPVAGNHRIDLELPSGEKRDFLEDGDEVILRGFAEDENHYRIGLGECRGVVLPANPS